VKERACLHRYFADSAARSPDSVAVVEPGHGSITYAQLDALSDRARDRFAAMGVKRGDRVGIYMRKSIDALAAIYGVLKAAAAYVPVDPGAPAARGAFILHNCAVKAIVIEAAHVDKFRGEYERLGGDARFLIVDRPHAGNGLDRALTAASEEEGTPALTKTVDSAPDDLAYILYTSGSTGKPKGVMLSHDNAVSFVDWCSDTFSPHSSDRFSSHAPFHFDLSILDIHVCLKHGATLVLIAEDIGKDATRLARLIADEKITIWYSAPSILGLLAQFGNLAHGDYARLRLVLFAGEVFAVKHLRALCERWSHPRYFNLYGPTETNVCTYYEVPTPVPPDRTTPYPIGYTCSHLASRVVDEDGEIVPLGTEGELCIAGRGVMKGYWSLPEQTARGFYRDADGTAWYRTGDIVTEAPDGCYTYLGRRDRMVKRRGYRVELGEIEAGLYRHPLVREAAAVALPDEESGIRIIAYLSCREPKHPSLIEIKRFCAEHLPLYMIPDQFSWHESLPKTSTDKIDYQRLKEMN
jgi:amino acid adenylation domain-containing protein